MSVVFKSFLRPLGSLLILASLPFNFLSSQTLNRDNLFSPSPAKFDSEPQAKTEKLPQSSVYLKPAAETDVHFVGVLIDVQGSSTPGAVTTRTIRVQEILDGPTLSGTVLVKWQALLYCWESYIESGLKIGDVVEVKGNLGFAGNPDVWLCGPGEETGSSYFIRRAVRPEPINDLTAITGTYPGEIILRWTAPSLDGGTTKVDSYTLRYWPWEISEQEWKYATDLESEPIPTLPGTVQTMTVNLKPGSEYFFAIKAVGPTGLSAPISNSPSARAAGYLVSDINSDLTYTPQDILGYHDVTIVATAARTDDWTFRLGDIVEVIKSISQFKDLKEVAFTLVDKGGWAALATYAKAVCVGLAADIALDLRSQVLWGLHPLEDGDFSLLLLDPNAPLLQPGVPYLIKGVLREKKLKPPFEPFYYLEVDDASKIVELLPSPTEPHFNIPNGYTFRYWVNIKLNEVTPLGDNVCTIGMVSERYVFNQSKYIRLRLMEGNESGLIVRVQAESAAPTLGSLVLACGTKRSEHDVYDGWQWISNYLNTTEGNGKVSLLRGKTSSIAGHEYLNTTKLVVTTGSPVDLHVWDDQQNHIGAIYDLQGQPIGYQNQLPDADYIPGTDQNSEAVIVGNPTSSIYYLNVQGKNSGVYTETIRIFDPSGEQTYFYSLPNQPTFNGKYDQIDFAELPAPPRGLTFDVTVTGTVLDWLDNSENDLLGYNIYRSQQRDGAYQKLNALPWSVSTFIDNETSTTQAYYYYVTAVDQSYNESGHLTPLANQSILYLPILIR